MPLLACGVLGALIFACLTQGGREARTTVPLAEQVDSLLVAAGFGINEIWLTGHRYTVDAELFAALGLETSGSLLRFDPRQARDRIERLSWIDTAAVTRVFPDQLRITVQERKPFAIWSHDGRDALVDASGRVLAYVAAGTRSELPRLRGAQAPSAAAELYAALHRHPPIAERVETAVRVGGRRWTLMLDGGTVVYLPAEGEAAAIERLAELQVRQPDLDASSFLIDLRLAGRTAVRRSGQTPDDDVRGGT